METSVSIELQSNPDIAVPRLVFDRAFAPDNDLPDNIDFRTGLINALNDQIACAPEKVLEDIAWLDAQLDQGEAIETLPFGVIKNRTEYDATDMERPTRGMIRDVFSITSNGSQFAFGETPQQSDAGWAIFFAKNNEIDREGIVAAQTRVYETQTMLRRARLGADVPETELAYWDQQHTIAKQHRALMRLQAVALIARGPVPETEEPEEAALPVAEATTRSGASRTIRRVRELVGSALMSMTL